MVADLQRNLIRTVLESSRGTNVPILPITSIFAACFAIALVALSFPISLRRMSPALVCALFGGKIGINDFQRNIWGKMKVGVARQIDEAQSTSHFN
ncbi:hypothetical protein BCY90_04550 [Agrobacterium deltaense]|nr:hypothetical protein L901_03430 [Agrobacterium sp. D14]RKF38000.1 hypothetical protein BCY90_04550 [Agrobacterium deltaense]